jgi:LysM repeat protein
VAYTAPRYETQPNFLADLQALGTDSSTPIPVMAPVMERAPAIGDAHAVESSLREVKVKKGDVLEKIARQNHVSVSDIMKVNKLSSSRLKIGQTLKIPSGGSKPSISTVSNDGAQYYTIKNGDNPWTIAVKHHMKVDELLKLNGMNEDKARRLKPGDRIRIKYYAGRAVQIAARDLRHDDKLALLWDPLACLHTIDGTADQATLSHERRSLRTRSPL